MKYFKLLLLLFILFLSCADKGNIIDITLQWVSYGEVIEKNYYPAHSHTETRYDYYYERWVMDTVHHSERYEIKIKFYDKFSDKTYFNNFDISENFYYQLQIGDFYGTEIQDKDYYISVKNEKNNLGFRYFKYHQIKNYKIGDYIIFDEVAK